jgi:PAS domain-containing protein
MSGVAGGGLDSLITAAATGIVTLGGGLAGMYALSRKMQRDAKQEMESLKRHTEAQVIRANGVPLKLLESLPIPAWCKDRDGKMLFVNFAYCQSFNIRPEDYIGKTDRDVWPLATAVAFAKHDDEVVRTMRRVRFREVVPADRYKPEGEQLRLLVEKFPVVNATRDSLIGPGGWCIWQGLLDSLMNQAEVWEDASLFSLDRKLRETG